MSNSMAGVIKQNTPTKRLKLRPVHFLWGGRNLRAITQKNYNYLRLRNKFPREFVVILSFVRYRYNKNKIVQLKMRGKF